VSGLFGGGSAVREAPVWPIFGDLMAGLVGLFVLFFVWSLLFQHDLARDLEAERRALEAERAARAAEAERMKALEAALAVPIASGRITLVEGRIGISGSVLFDLNSAALRPEGIALLSDLAKPLAAWLGETGDLVMVGGYTDDLPIRRAGAAYADNWELSTERALTVTRTLVGSGVPPGRLFAAGFGEHHPTAPNEDESGRARNRRVEIVPVPRSAAAPR
jgi:flagellar motor protein MotB